MQFHITCGFMLIFPFRRLSPGGIGHIDLISCRKGHECRRDDVLVFGALYIKLVALVVL